MDKIKDVDTYIANAPTKARDIMILLRKIIKETIPNVEEKISWNVPFYRYNGEIGGYAFYKKHVSVGFGEDSISEEIRKTLIDKGYKVAKGTMQIKFGQDIPINEIISMLNLKIKNNENN